MEQQTVIPPKNEAEINDAKVLAAIGYIGILCLLPLLLKKGNRFAEHHGKQGLVLFIAEIVLAFINIIPILGQLIWLIGIVILFIFSIKGIMKALQGEYWELPILGDYAKKITL